MIRALALFLALAPLACAEGGPWERACLEGDEACDEAERCERNLGLPGYTVTHSVCAPLCDRDAECPPPGSGNAESECSARGVCELRCGAAVACPSGMVCASNRCKWPH